jgi:hypothetical protein
MDQCRMTHELVEWIRANPWDANNRVRYDGQKTNPYTLGAEHCSLYIGEKRKGTGRRSQVTQVDILVENSATMTVDLLIELEPTHGPKKVLGEVLPALLADNYTPSNCCGKRNQRHIKDALFLFFTVVERKQRSQKREQLGQLERAIIEGLDFHKLAVRTVAFCVGNSEPDAIHVCKDQIQRFFADSLNRRENTYS